MGFYIIEINDKYKQVVLLSAEGELYCKDVAGLMPYTEPDLEQVRKEAYEEGYAEGSKEDYDEAYLNGYNQGLEDAWETARKIIHMPEGDLLNIFTECYSAVCTSVQVFLKYDASEAIEKIRQYEQEERFHVGDEIETQNGFKGFVIREDDKYVYFVNENGEGCVETMMAAKTGRHFPEIAVVLEKMREV